jgi:Ni,Fe-hydrogenase I cytochrome b subunit
MSYLVRIVALMLLVADTVGLGIFSYYALNRVRSAPDSSDSQTMQVAIWAIIAFVIVAIITALLASAGTDNEDVNTHRSGY